MSRKAQTLLLGPVAPQWTQGSSWKHPHWPDQHLLFLFLCQKQLVRVLQGKQEYEEAQGHLCVCDEEDWQGKGVCRGHYRAQGLATPDLRLLLLSP